MLNDIDAFHAKIALGIEEHEKRLERLSKVRITSGAELMQKHFEEPKYLWDSILPDAGLAVMAASKASGKTMILLQLAAAISKGDEFLGLPTQRAKTLFLELELSERRTQQRLLKMGIVPDKNFNFAFKWPRGETGLQLLTDAVREGGYKLVIVDVLQLLWPQRADSNNYQDSYGVLAPLRQMANELNVTVILVTHRRKAEAVDYLDGTIGSVGILGNADVIFSLMRTRGEQEAVLYIDGNDVEARKIGLQFSGSPLGFSLSGASADEIQLTPERRAIMDAIRELGGTASTRDIALALGKDEGNTSRLLKKLATVGLIQSTSYGKWIARNTEQSVQTNQDVQTLQSVQSIQSLQSVQSTQSENGSLYGLYSLYGNTSDHTIQTDQLPHEAHELEDGTKETSRAVSNVSTRSLDSDQSNESDLFVDSDDAYSSSTSHRSEETKLMASAPPGEKEIADPNAACVLAWLSELYEEHKENLRKGGIPAINAHVELEELRERATVRGLSEKAFQKVFIALLDSERIIYEEPYVRLNYDDK